MDNGRGRLSGKEGNVSRVEDHVYRSERVMTKHN